MALEKLRGLAGLEQKLREKVRQEMRPIVAELQEIKKLQEEQVRLLKKILEVLERGK